MRAILWYVVFVHTLAALFFVRRWQTRRRTVREARLSLMIAYLALAPALGAARELHWFRVNVAGAIALVSAVLGSILLAFIWDAHLRRRRS